MASVFGFARRNWQLFNPSQVSKSAEPLRFGILGAANIAPQAFIGPAGSHPDVVVQTVAARDLEKAKAYAQKHGILEASQSYQDILDDPNIDCVYIPLPNGFHFEWALRALKAGKHVLLEKPSANNAREAEILFNSPFLDKPKAPILLEAAHYVFHPAWTAFFSQITPAEVASAKAVLWVPGWLFADDNIRFRYDLGGGALMDLGAYSASILSRIFGGLAEECEECTVKAIPEEPRCDHLFKARYRFPNGGWGEMEGDIKAPFDRISPNIFVEHKPVVVPGTDVGIDVPRGQEVVRTRKVNYTNFMQPTFYHSIQVDDEFAIRNIGDTSGQAIKKWTDSKTIKAYTFHEAGINQPGETHWSSYRYQLETFVNRVRGQETKQWVDGVDSITTMKMIVMAYTAANLPLRPTSAYTPTDGTI
ncbi:hypothetical protein M426DRAFT_64871 [Hypoxylon sp. CI-4A]|nr:hypothetical protein M426DRAFT_64871 [Hypoxylon sp. CI-4A]